MFLDNDDKEKIIQYLINNKQHIKDNLLKDLEKQKEEVLKVEDPAFKDDIEVEFVKIARLIVAQDIGKTTGLAPDGILYTLEYMGIPKFLEYLK